MTYLDLKDKYSRFIYDKYEIKEEDNIYKITYYFEIEGLAKFNPSLEINKKDIVNKNINHDFLNDLVFHIGLVELISYWKCAMPKEVIINCGYLNEDQIQWFKKMYYYGLGEFFYQNNINISMSDFMFIKCLGKKNNYQVTYEGKGNLIPVGGGKDSLVTLSILSGEYDNNTAFVINPKKAHNESIEVTKYENKSIFVKRNLDKKIIDLNSEGFLNGHTPFSALVSFVSLLVAYLSNKKYIVLSNENSANEANVVGTNVNHQYSKSYEYECDFNNYVNEYFNIDIHYFSLLRPLSEIQIAYLFSKHKEYFKVFRSCNVGSKKEGWNWCCNCAKCLFVYIILSPFISKEELLDIFGEDLFAKESLLDIFLELTGNSDHKPFECVGTYEEVNYAIMKTINKYKGNLPYLLEYYQKHFSLTKECDILHRYNEENSLPLEYANLVRGEIDG